MDLSRRKLELEQLFPSVINKMSDLCHPPAHLLAGEEDYFNKTRDLKLKPFKRQEVFERCVTPTLDEQRHESVTSPTGDFIKIERSTSSCWPAVSRSIASSRLGGALELSGDGFEKKDKLNNQRGGVKSKSKSKSKKRHAGGEQQQQQQQQQMSAETRKKLELRNWLHAHYSSLKLKPRPAIGETRRRQLDCLNKISIDTTSGKQTGSAYPFANPMPECMLTCENLGNLREIILAASDIEWRMLTPVRPTNDYEEQYFDKLIQLHRRHYKYQVDEIKLAREVQRPKPGGCRPITGPVILANRSKFAHTRHGSSVAPKSLQNQRVVGGGKQQSLVKSQVTMSLGIKLKGKFHTCNSNFNGGKTTTSLNVPRLILTADNEVNGGAANRDDDESETTMAVALEQDNLQGAAPPTLAPAASHQAQTRDEREASLQCDGRPGSGSLQIAGAHVALQTRGTAAVAIAKRREHNNRDAQHC